MDIDIAGNAINPKVIVIGCMHGDEQQGCYFINEYLEATPDTALMMIPCLNKFGYENNKRTNKNGVDLNRNFPTKNWELGIKNEYFGGEFPASEEETKFLISIIEKYSPKAILTIHSPYKVVNYDGGKSGEGKNLADMISKILGYPVESDIGYPTPGSFGTWAGIERDIPTITLELDENADYNTLIKPMFDVFRVLEKY